MDIFYSGPDSWPSPVVNQSRPLGYPLRMCRHCLLSFSSSICIMKHCKCLYVHEEDCNYLCVRREGVTTCAVSDNATEGTRAGDSGTTPAVPDGCEAEGLQTTLVYSISERERDLMCILGDEAGQLAYDSSLLCAT
ncbi:hypothetical protein KP509_16G016700 [Ceratopteris richardii]|uniref:Uncharacterized protein n=1 Tax=Ceratopteris richardii TaxID=49495 RepID=A0A8T2SYF6_CERRI|nr:hypothetical protein KP509_16G016700 [Ceratopteris richardii]